jgi:signal transduction histidine kinase/DNA-binding response OmpR family regulator
MPETEKANVLIVDDLPEKILVYQSVLEELDQELIAVRSGPEALKQVLHQEFAVILLDVNMPGMDGFETAALIRARRKSSHTPIIFITSFADDVLQARGYAHGAVDYILAPVVPEVLRAKVQVFVDLFLMTQQVKRQAEERVALAEERSKRAAAEESNRRLAFLARASEVLGQTLDPHVTARDLARLPVPFLADFTAVALAGEGGRDAGVVLATAEGGGCREEAVPRDRLPADIAAAVARTLAGGRAEYLPAAPPPSGDSPTTAVVLPLHASGRVCAALALSRAASGRRFGPAELSMAETLASRAAVALDNARLYQDVQEADRQKNEFLSMLAHELRNPLAPIRNAVHVLHLQASDQPETHWARDVIDRQVKHLTRLVDDLLDVSRITGGKIRLVLEPVEISRIVAEAVEASGPVIREKRHHLDVHLPGEPLWVEGDAARLAQVLTNLLNNAAKYTDEGGHIGLDAGREEGQVVLRVRDTGIGIPAEMLAAVFNLFTQVDRSLDRSQGGLGVGLTLVRRLVELHGGSVQAYSEGPGRGSEFVVRLPALAGRNQRSGDAGGADLPSAPRTASRVLVVDDNVDGAESLAMLLRLGGSEVVLAHDGPAGLEAAREFRPDVVVLDIGLPGMDGYEVARRLRADPATKDALLVAVTGYGRDEDRALSREAGFDHHLVKPVDLSHLHEAFASPRAFTRNGARA